MAGVTAMVGAMAGVMLAIAMALAVAMTVVMVEVAMVPAAVVMAAAAMEVCMRTFLCYYVINLRIVIPRSEDIWRFILWLSYGILSTFSNLGTTNRRITQLS